MGKRLLDYIVKEIKKAKYYSICVDSTPDVSHTDQLTFIIRYVKNSEPIERFLKFIPIHGHTAETLFKEVVGMLNDNEILLENCRGQSYDNASNMSGKYTGLQARISAENPLAEFIPCASHSLNLVGVAAAECNLEATKLFAFIQAIYKFFSASTNRWNILLSVLDAEKKKIIKPLSTTRWSARADAVTALKENYKAIELALESIMNDGEQSSDTKLTAENLKKIMRRFETVFLVNVWNDVLYRINHVNKILQKPSLTLAVTVKILKSLKDYIELKRNSFEKYENAAMQMTGLTNYDSEVTEVRNKKRSSRITFFDDKKTADSSLSGRDKLRVQTFLPIIDTLNNHLQSRTDAYVRVFKTFGFLEDLTELEMNQLEKSCYAFASHFKNDICASEMFEECIQLQAYLKDECLEYTASYKDTFEDCDRDTNFGTKENEEMEGSGKETLSRKLNLKNIYRHLSDNGLITAFPNIEISLRIYLSMMVSNASAERSFSKLKLIKNELRNSMKQNRLNNLSILSIENELLQTIDFKDLIDDFAEKKCRKKFI